MAASSTAPLARLRATVVSSERRLVLTCIAATLLLRLPFVFQPLGIDEGGYAFVAANWGEGSGGIYGAQWVDRPPLLIALYAIAHALAADIGVRLLGCVAAVVVVATCADAAGRIAGPRAMRWSGVVAAVLASSTATQANTVNAELPAIAFTSTAAWLVVCAVTASGGARRLWLGVLAGVAAMAAVLVKQSFVDGFAFALAFAVVWGALARRADGARLRLDAARLLVAGLAGAGVALAATVAWAELWGPGFGTLLDALYGFRLDARAAIEAAPNAPSTRAWYLLTVTALTGMLSLLAYVVVGLLRVAIGRLPDVTAERRALLRGGAAGLLAMGALGMVGVVMGGNWWVHYLTQLAPFLAMGVGVVAATPRPAAGRVVRSSRRWAAVLVVTTLLTWCGTLTWSVLERPQGTPTAVGDWLAEASRPGDSAIVTWGHANVLHRSGLDSPYRLSWSLPVRVQDPELAELHRVLEGPDAPTWIVEWRPFSSWGLDPTGRVRTTVWRRYERVPDVCGKTVYRLRSRGADPVPIASPEACGSGRGLSIRDVKLF